MKCHICVVEEKTRRTRGVHLYLHQLEKFTTVSQFAMHVLLVDMVVFSTTNTINCLNQYRPVAIPFNEFLVSPLQNMALPSVMVLPLLIVVAAGVYYIYNEVMHFMSKSLVRNKVVVITDAASGVGTGKVFTKR